MTGLKLLCQVIGLPEGNLAIVEVVPVDSITVHRFPWKKFQVRFTNWKEIASPPDLMLHYVTVTLGALPASYNDPVFGHVTLERRQRSAVSREYRTINTELWTT